MRDPEAKLPPTPVPLKSPKQSPWLKTRSSLTLVSWALLMEDVVSQSRDSCECRISDSGKTEFSAINWESQPGFLLSFSSQQPPPTLENLCALDTLSPGAPCRVLGELESLEPRVRVSGCRSGLPLSCAHVACQPRPRPILEGLQGASY